MDRDFFLLEAGFAISMFFGTFLSYLLPLKFTGSKRRIAASDRIDHLNESITDESNQVESTGQKIVRCLNCVGAGIFVAICFLGLMPIVREEFSLFFSEAQITGVTYPVSELTVLFGFFLILFVEEVVHSCQREDHHHHQPVLNLDEPLTNEQERQSLIDNAAAYASLQQNDDEDNFEEVACNDSYSVSIADKNKNGGSRSKKKNAALMTPMGVDDFHTHSHAHSHSVNPNATGMTFFILMFATSVHSIFEGLALGLIKESSRAVHIYIGIILHECIVAAALGLNASRLNSSFRQNVKFAVMFSATIPVGIFMGVGLGYTPGSLGRFISAIFQGLAAGTFLHVTFCELIPAELAPTNPRDKSLANNRLFKIFLIFLGYVLMSLFTLLFDH